MVLMESTIENVYNNVEEEQMESKVKRRQIIKINKEDKRYWMVAKESKGWIYYEKSKGATSH